MAFRYRVPGNATRLSSGGDWASHIARGSTGGADFPDPVGTPMRAMAAGVVELVDNDPAGSGGRRVIVRHGKNDRTELLHAKWITAEVGDEVGMGHVLGESGASGFGRDDYYVGHIHAHGLYDNGVRFDVVPFIDFSNPTGGGFAGGGLTPISEEQDMTTRLVRFGGTSTYLFNSRTNTLQATDGGTLPGLEKIFGPPADFSDSTAFQAVRDLYGNTMADVDEAQKLAAEIRAAIAGIQPGGQVDTAALSKALGLILAPLLDDEAQVKAAVADATSRLLASIAAVPAAKPVEYVLVPKA